MRKALSLTLAGVLAGTGLLGAAATPAYAVGYYDYACAASVSDVGSFAVDLPSTLQADSPTSMSVTVDCPVQQKVFLSQASLSLMSAQGVTRYVSLSTSTDPVELAATANGRFGATYQVVVPALDGLVEAGTYWVSGLSAVAARPYSSSSSPRALKSTLKGVPSPLALPALQSPTVKVGRGAYAAPQPLLPSALRLGSPAEADLGEWGTDAALRYEWLASDDSVLSQQLQWVPTVESTDIRLRVSATWPDGTERTVDSRSVAARADGGFSELRVDGPVRAYGAGLRVIDVRRDGSRLPDPSPWTKRNGWYRLSDAGVALGFSATQDSEPVHWYNDWVPTAEHVGQRFIYVRGQRLTSLVITVAKGTTPQPIETGYAGSLAYAPTLASTTIRPGAKISLTNPWPSGVPVTYSWLRDGKTKVGSGSAYTVTLADVGRTVQGLTSTTSTAFTGTEVKAKAFKVAPALMVAPKLTLNRSTAVVGQKLSVTASGGTRGATVKYQWYRNNKPITGATGTSYTLAGADWGQRIGVETRSTMTGYTSASAAAYLGRDVGYGTIVKGKLTIKGKVKVGSKLTASRSGASTPGLEVRYQWYRNGKKVWGAEKSTYKLSKADRGKRITVVVNLHKQGYKQTSLTAKTGRVI